MGLRVVISSTASLAGGGGRGVLGSSVRPGLFRSISSIRLLGKSNGVWKAEKASKVLGRGCVNDRGASTGLAAAATGGEGVLARGRDVTGCLKS